ncbi:hypothetical protein [Streptomyces sp. NBC_01190]|uniref:hypothetical protein n=1 Tax=Streptomyces sp. NBC_01190 TaxID=2903767 RepID=UPI00386A0E2F|nr:hypothetical protein OG519_18050 [Streptomyces sp. NBC_01190]
MSFIQKLVEVTAKGFEAGDEAVEEYVEHRRAAKLFLKLGIAVYAEQRLNGSHVPVERILLALDGHAAEHGEVDLDHLEAAREVLGEEFIAELNADDAAAEADPVAAPAPAAPAAAPAEAAPAAPVAAP